MKILYLHIGTPNTGASAIRNFCEINRKALESEGYCYPGSVPDLNEDGEIEGMDAIRSLFEKYENVIVSDESLYERALREESMFWEKLADEAKGFRIRIIVYLRRQDGYVSACWNHLLRDSCEPLEMSWEEYRGRVPEDIRADYYSAISRIAAILGRENIIVRVFECGRFFGGMLETDFLHSIGLKLTAAYTIPADPADSMLAGNAREIKRILNTLSDIRPEENEFLSNVLTSCVSGENRLSGGFSAEEFSDFMEPYLEGNRRIALDYLGEEDSVLFNMAYTDSGKWKRDNSGMTDDLIRFVGESSRRLLDMIDERSASLKEEREKAEALENRIRALEKGRGGILKRTFGKGK